MKWEDFNVKNSISNRGVQWGPTLKLLHHLHSNLNSMTVPVFPSYNCSLVFPFHLLFFFQSFIFSWRRVSISCYLIQILFSPMFPVVRKIIYVAELFSRSSPTCEYISISQDIFFNTISLAVSKLTVILKFSHHPNYWRILRICILYM